MEDAIMLWGRVVVALLVIGVVAAFVSCVS